jgi:hypothetical protein
MEGKVRSNSAFPQITFTTPGQVLFLIPGPAALGYQFCRTFVKACVFVDVHRYESYDSYDLNGYVLGIEQWMHILWLS